MRRGSHRLTHTEFIQMLRNSVDNAGSQKALAKDLGISEQYLTDLLRGRRMPGRQVLGALGMVEVRLYERMT